MNLGKEAHFVVDGQTFCLAELVDDGQDKVDQINVIASLSINVLHHILVYPLPEGSFNQKYGERTNFKIESWINIFWHDAVHRRNLKNVLVSEFELGPCKLEDLEWSLETVPQGDGKAVSIVFGQVELMNRIYERGLRTRPSLPAQPLT